MFRRPSIKMASWRRASIVANVPRAIWSLMRNTHVRARKLRAHCENLRMSHKKLCTHH